MINDDVRDLIIERYNKYYVISQYFPLELSNKAEVKGVVAHCSECNGVIPSLLLRGELRETVGSCFRVTSIGRCEKCDILVPYAFHIVPNGDGYDFVPLSYRGWVEQREGSSVIPFKATPRKKRKSRVTATANTV